VSEAVKDGDELSEQAGRVTMAKESAFVIELGGSERCPVDRTEREWKATWRGCGS
jgi:hypothetical protein